MITCKDSCKFLVPMVLGFYSLVQGTALAINHAPMIQLAGICVLLWVPGCAYYTCHGRKALSRRAVQEQLGSTVALIRSDLRLARAASNRKSGAAPEQA